MIDFYNHVDPSKVGKVSAQLKKYKGREQELFRKLATRYKPQLDALQQQQQQQQQQQLQQQQQQGSGDGGAASGSKGKDKGKTGRKGKREKQEKMGDGLTQYVPVGISVGVGSEGEQAEMQVMVPTQGERAIADPQTLFQHVKGTWDTVVEVGYERLQHHHWPHHSPH